MQSSIDWSSLKGEEPNELLLLSMRLGRRLPEELHLKMLLWSFDDTHAHVVKDYLEWIDHCQRRDENTERIKKRMQYLNKMNSILSLYAMLLGLLLMTAIIISKKI